MLERSFSLDETIQELSAVMKETRPLGEHWNHLSVLSDDGNTVSQTHLLTAHVRLTWTEDAFEALAEVNLVDTCGDMSAAFSNAKIWGASVAMCCLTSGCSGFE